jgi:hypothetical protein
MTIKPKKSNLSHIRIKEKFVLKLLMSQKMLIYQMKFCGGKKQFSDGVGYEWMDQLKLQCARKLQMNN